MSGSGLPSFDTLDAHGMRVAIVASRWHDEVMAGLVDGAQRALDDAGVTDRELVRAAGCFEVPLVAQALAARGFQAVVALGVVVRGGTPHFDYVCRAVTDGLSRVTLDSGVPVGFGILTCDDSQQALDRAGLPGSREDKGYEAAHAAMSTALVLTEVAALGA